MKCKQTLPDGLVVAVMYVFCILTRAVGQRFEGLPEE